MKHHLLIAAAVSLLVAVSADVAAAQEPNVECFLTTVGQPIQSYGHVGEVSIGGPKDVGTATASCASATTLHYEIQAVAGLQYLAESVCRPSGKRCSEPRWEWMPSATAERLAYSTGGVAVIDPVTVVVDYDDPEMRPYVFRQHRVAEELLVFVNGTSVALHGSASQPWYV